MAVEVKPHQTQAFITARQELHLTQLELSEKAKISLRSIKDLESGRRMSFNEDTLIRICKALGLQYEEILNTDNYQAIEHPMVVISTSKKIRSKLIYWSFLAGIILGIFIYKYISSSYKRTDWILNRPMKVFYYNPVWGNENAIHVNWYHTKQTVTVDDTIGIELKWSFHFVEGSYPKYYVCAYTLWDPDRRIDIFGGVLKGEGSMEHKFKIIAPKNPDIYKIRIFFSSSFGPVSSYYGHPPDNQLESPAFADYILIPLEVISKK